MRIVSKVLMAVVMCVIAIASKAQVKDSLPSLHKPLNIPLVLSGNFGELRSNHFHSGIDFKTQGKTGFRIYCAADGYVSRVLVSPWGFGRAVYVNHPSLGLTTVYGHLESFASKIDKIVVAEQYKQESFRVDLEFKEGEIPVKKGEVIAFSGNSGSSGGPHLHMDVRDLETGDALDPLNYYKNLLDDKAKPELRLLALYPYDGKGIVNDTTVADYRQPAEIPKPFTAWGQVVPGIKAYDKMTGVSNIFGIKYLMLLVDGKIVYRRTIDRFAFSQTRAVNTLFNYADKKHSWVMTTDVPSSMPLDDMVMTDASGGVLNITEQRDYKCQFVMEDIYGNKSTVKFVIKGKRGDIPAKVSEGTPFHYDGYNTYNMNGLYVHFPVGTFYDDIDFTVKNTSSDKYYSDIHEIGNVGIPLHQNCNLKITLINDTISDKSKYCLVRINGKKRSAVSARYNEGKMEANINRMGSYAVTIDKTPPKIVAHRKKKWATGGYVAFKISDNLSGVETFRGTVDGKWVCFEYDGKNALVKYKFESSRVTKGKKHKVIMTVTDACGNKASLTEYVTW